MLIFLEETIQIKKILPILEKHYGFDYSEIAYELSMIYNRHYVEKRIDTQLEKECLNEDGFINPSLYGLESNDTMDMPVSDNFAGKMDEVKKVCQQFSVDETTELALLFISAIFDRDENAILADSDFGNELSNMEMEIHYRRPDLLKLYIALNEKRHKYNTPIKICFKNDSPHEINNGDGWFSRMLNDYIQQQLGDISIKEAKEELCLHQDKKGRKSDTPYLNYIINGTYNLVAETFPNEKKKVTVEQCKFIQQYLKAIGYETSKLNDINYLQSTIVSLISSKSTPVQKHVHKKSLKGLPNK